MIIALTISSLLISQLIQPKFFVKQNYLQNHDQFSSNFTYNFIDPIIYCTTSIIMEVQKKMRFNLFLGFLMLNIFWAGVKSQCNEGCNSLASYYVWQGSNLTFISATLSTTINNIVSYNPQITNPDVIQFGSRVNVPFSCGCVNNEFMGHQFVYVIRRGNFYQRIADLIYSNLTTVEMLTRFNSYEPESIPEGGQLNVTVNCSCGNSRVSRDYGLFVTYPLRPGESLSAIANESGLPERLLQDYNPGVDFNRGSGLVFVPGRDQNGTFPPLNLNSSSSAGISGGAIAGISIAAIVGAVSLAACFYFVFYRRKKVKEESFLLNNQSIENGPGIGLMEKTSEPGPLASPKLKGITVDKSVEFTYEELALATNDFSLSNKIGQGGFGAVYYGELRGEKAGIKKMDMQASKEFLAELKVLTHVHHVNLVRLIGYCVEGSLFLVYEYIDNGNLSQHLRGKVTEPLPWSTRVQIALDSARGLEYIHEHTVPVYIHRDIKSPNILIDSNFRAKVADFGLAKLTEVGSASLQTRLVGTFGYMPPEYAQYGDVSPKIDVYAFGVVLFELISAKEAIVKTNEVITESKGLVALFEDAFNQPDQNEAIGKLVDPRLGDDYPFDSVFKVAHLAKACTHENPQLRPSMRSIVVALMTLSSSTEDWDIGSFYENQGLVHLMSGR
ncbi:hypothetical protein BUALT_Bualt18G0099200 [Buddleja alternifolia]|uniref:non-specific serine/threonine protein kinase n=1 Tax=Buddleja alternifolia TaxID=168488 RepID=A0AAV6WED4_9LAMI|nr:hypothetical protein BUALT_Bualt18G0099200 [Buddleja alternifolia]